MAPPHVFGNIVRSSTNHVTAGCCEVALGGQHDFGLGVKGEVVGRCERGQGTGRGDGVRDDGWKAKQKLGAVEGKLLQWGDEGAVQRLGLLGRAVLVAIRPRQRL